MSDQSDRIQIHELINLHGHLMDEGQFDRLSELFVETVVYDLTAYGAGVLEGVQAVGDAGLALGSRNALGHHVTNIVVTDIEGDRAHALSKGLAVRADGGVGSVVYDDELRRTGAGWRIAGRRVLPRHTPLAPSGPPNAAPL